MRRRSGERAKPAEELALEAVQGEPGRDERP
jgi:hypothetical protein